MSFQVRANVSSMAQSRAPASRKVIVTFGVGRFQEWSQMMVRGFSYTAVDLNIDITTVSLKVKSCTIAEYNFKKSFSTQLILIARMDSTILWAKYKSDDFIQRDDVHPDHKLDQDSGGLLVQHLVSHPGHQHAQDQQRSCVRVQICPQRHAKIRCRSRSCDDEVGGLEKRLEHG
jgi:hypothetical protein